MKRFIEFMKDFLSKNNDPFYYISEEDWAVLCETIRETNEIVDWFDFLANRYTATLKETSELISDCDLQVKHFKIHSDNFSDFILITYMILNYQDEYALSKFNELLWEDKLLYCKFILGDNVVIYIK